MFGYFNDGLLSMAYGELGVRVYKKTEHDGCLTDNGFIELNDSELCIENYNNLGDFQNNKNLGIFNSFTIPGKTL